MSRHCRFLRGRTCYTGRRKAASPGGGSERTTAACCCSITPADRLTNSWNKVSSALLWLEQGGEKARPPPAPGTQSGAVREREEAELQTGEEAAGSSRKESIQRKSRKFCFNTAETDSLSQFGKFPASNISGFCLSKRCFDFNSEKRSDVDVSVRPQHNVLFALSSS